jgi:hypothetical protein
MKKRFLKLGIVVAISCSILFSSCIGSFSLSNKLLAWNQTVDSKFINALIFIPLLPVYGIALTGDALLFNTIEFWSGENPIEAGIVKTIQGDNGVYTVETLKDGYHIEDETGQVARFVYDKESNTWSLVANEKTTKLVTISDDNKSAVVYLPGSKERTVELSNRGILELRQYVEDSQVCFASR